MKILFDILRGMVIGLANIIPGVSGGTMMVSMGIYDTIIHCINQLFKEFKKSIKTLAPYFIGMALAVVALSFLLKWLFAHYPLPTNTLFVGLILGGLPAIFKEMRGTKKGIPGAVLLLLFAALVIVLPVLQHGAARVLVPSLGNAVVLFLLGVMASATMMIPGVSGSMMLKILGYYDPIVTGALPSLISGLTHGDWAAAGASIALLLPFAIGIVVGIFAIAKLIEMLLAKWKGYTYCAILGMVVASPIVILMGGDNYRMGLSVPLVLVSLVTFAVGAFAALKLSRDPEKVTKA